MTVGYRLVREGDGVGHEARFEAEVTRLLNEGWVLAGPATCAISREWTPVEGGHYYSAARWAQPMVKDVL